MTEQQARDYNILLEIKERVERKYKDKNKINIINKKPRIMFMSNVEETKIADIALCEKKIKEAEDLYSKNLLDDRSFKEIVSIYKAIETELKKTMKNIHIIPTDKPSRLVQRRITKELKFSLMDNPQLWNNVNIYITSDEEIKEGDWFYNTISLKPEPFKACENGDIYVNCSKYSHYRIDCKKIILTTDQDLIKYGVQAIDDEFLQWFVKNPSCEEVKVVEKQHFEADKSKRKNPLNGVYYSYKIIIPKEELTASDEAKQRAKNHMSLKGALEPKQETLEDELWGNVFAKIKQYGLNNEVLTILKQKFNISKR